jgi:hypothetical protein
VKKKSEVTYIWTKLVGPLLAAGSGNRIIIGVGLGSKVVWAGHKKMVVWPACQVKIRGTFQKEQIT